MKVCVWFPGRIKPKELSAAQEEYVRRLKVFGVEVSEYKSEPVSAGGPERAKEAEAARILKQLKPTDCLVACDERGKATSTRALADFIESSRRGEGMFGGKKRVVVVVGGAHGLAESIRTEAQAVWSLSPLVMAGGIARLVLLEGLYRAFTVVENHPYHNE